MSEQVNDNVKIEDLQEVLEISRSMAATVDIDSLLALIVSRGVKLLNAERGTLFLHDKRTNELVVRTISGGEAFRCPADKGVCGETIKTGQTINVPDAYSDERFNQEVDRKTGFRTRNILSVPLKSFQGDLVGVFQVLNKRSGSFDEYDISLAETLGSQAGVAIQRSSLIDHYVEKQKMDRDMQIARSIQQDLLPEDNPHACGFDISGINHPADETGGDTYDFMPLPDGRWMIIIADASGHGIGPALVAAETRAMLRVACMSAAENCDISFVLRNINSLLEEDMRNARFVTCFLGLLDPLAAKLTYASAGHGPLIFIEGGGSSIRTERAKSIPLGVLDEFDFSDVDEFTFARGDMLTLITDGYIEATNPAKEDFGVDRVCGILKEGAGLPASELVDRLYRSVVEFRKGKPQDDDLTAVVIKRK